MSRARLPDWVSHAALALLKEEPRCKEHDKILRLEVFATDDALEFEVSHHGIVSVCELDSYAVVEAARSGANLSAMVACHLNTWLAEIPGHLATEEK